MQRLGRAPGPGAIWEAWGPCGVCTEQSVGRGQAEGCTYVLVALGAGEACEQSRAALRVRGFKVPQKLLRGRANWNRSDEGSEAQAVEALSESHSRSEALLTTEDQRFHSQPRSAGSRARQGARRPEPWRPLLIAPLFPQVPWTQTCLITLQR